MITLGSLGTIDPIYVSRLDGFNLPQTAVLTTLLNDGTSTQDQVLQQGAVPLRVAGLAGVIFDAADLTTLRGYHTSKESVAFDDGNGNTTNVRVFDLAVTDFTDRWEFAATLIEAA